MLFQAVAQKEKKSEQRKVYYALKKISVIARSLTKETMLEIFSIRIYSSDQTKGEQIMTTMGEVRRGWWSMVYIL